MPRIRKLSDWAGLASSPQSGATGDGPPSQSVFMVGLGRFGSSMARELIALNIEVMAIDTDQELIDRWASKLSHVRRADGTDTETLRQLGVASFDTAVVAIGSDIEASILTTAALADLDGPTIWAKALTEEHGRILRRVGADHVVFPEKQMGERVAHVVSGRVIDYFELDDSFAIAELRSPRVFVGKTLGEAGIRQKYGVTVFSVKPPEGTFTYATAETRIGENDLLLVAGEIAACERFAAAAAANEK